MRASSSPDLVGRLGRPQGREGPDAAVLDHEHPGACLAAQEPHAVIVAQELICNRCANSWLDSVRPPRVERSAPLFRRPTGLLGDRAGCAPCPQQAHPSGADTPSRLDLPAFHLVGHSLGGAVALEFALRRAERVRSLALVAPPPPGGVATVRKGGSRFARILRGSIPATLRRWLPCARATGCRACWGRTGSSSDGRSPG